MKHRFFFLSLLSIVALNSCNKETKEETCIPEKDTVEYKAANDYLESLSAFHFARTRSGEVTPENIQGSIEPLLSESINFLNAIEYDYTEDFEADDIRIIEVALMTLEYACIEQLDESQRSAFWSNTYNVTLCILVGGDAGALTSLGLKAVAKKFAKQALKKAVPYVGTAVAVAEAALCIYEHFNGDLQETYANPQITDAENPIDGPSTSSDPNAPAGNTGSSFTNVPAGASGSSNLNIVP